MASNLTCLTKHKLPATDFPPSSGPRSVSLTAVSGGPGGLREFEEGLDWLQECGSGTKTGRA